MHPTNSTRTPLSHSADEPHAAPPTVASPTVVDAQVDLPDGDATDEDPPRWKRIAKLLVHIAQGLALLAVALLYLAYAVETNQRPLANWVRDTPLETLARQIAPFLHTQRHRLAEQALDAPLKPHERTALEPLLKRMAAIRPTHVVVTTDGITQFGRLHANDEDPSQVRLEVFDGTRFSNHTLPNASIRFRSTLVGADMELTPRDYRFLLRYPDMNHFILPPYLIATPTAYGAAQSVHFNLEQIDEDFRKAFAPIIADASGNSLTHVCLFGSKAAYLEECAASEQYGLMNADGFYRRTDRCLVLALPSEPLANAVKNPQAKDGGDGPAIELRTVIRHEGTHQLIDILQLLPSANRPLWLEEGIAQYYEQPSPDQLNAARMGYLATAKAEGRLIPIEQLVTYRTSDTFDGDTQLEQVIYAEAWWLVHHLMEPANRPAMLAYLLQLQSATPESTVSTPVGMMNILGTTASKLMTRLESQIDEYSSQPQPAPPSGP